jgi:CheY-like chemotaxis protein
MRTADSTVLIVDDDDFYREILNDSLKDAGYLTVEAADGLPAWELLQQSPERFDAVLLDRKMPQMGGLELLERVKNHPRLNALPVVLQTTLADKEQVLEGLRAGAYYYLTKPFEQDKLLAIVQTAVEDYRRLRSLRTEMQSTAHTLAMMDQGRFVFKTLNQGRDLVTLISNAFPEGAKISTGLLELVVNAIEHGNLGIGYSEKSRLNEQGSWEQEVLRRLKLPENNNKFVTLTFERTAREVRFKIEDKGEGFDWRDYLEISPERAFDNHGRGIALAKKLSFDHLEFLGRGNLAVATVLLPPDDDAPPN